MEFDVTIGRFIIVTIKAENGRAAIEQIKQSPEYAIATKLNDNKITINHCTMCGAKGKTEEVGENDFFCDTCVDQANGN